MPSDLLTRVKSADAPDNVLTERQAHELQQGVRAAIEHSEERPLGLPSEYLTPDAWDHAGVGISVYIHRKSGVVVLNSGDETIVTDVSTLDNMSLARSQFQATTGGITRINDSYPDDYPENAEVTDQ